MPSSLASIKPTIKSKSTKTPLHSLDDIRHYFANQKSHYYFISASHFNLMNLDRWVNHWHHINFIDCFDGNHPAITLPSKARTPVFESLEAINEFLLGHSELVKKIEQERDPECTSKAIFLFFDQHIEALCEQLELEICLPPNQLIKHIDNKIITTEIGNEAGVSSVPNAIAKVSSYSELMQIAKAYKLGRNLVVQTPFGDSGKTTFFIESEDDYKLYSAQIEAEKKVKIMKRIRCAGSAIEACATAAGTFVGPLLSELIGYKELTPYAGGWCGNELYQQAFSESIRSQAQQMTEQLGDALYKRNYRGYFEVDYLIDLDTGAVYLGELNPRITGISAMTNMSHFADDTVPLFLFHLLEYDQIEITIDPTDYNARSLAEGAKSTAGQLIMKHTDPMMKKVLEAPISGVYQFGSDCQLKLKKPSWDRREAHAENEVFVMRILQQEEYAYKGADMAIVFTNINLQQHDGLTPKATELINNVHQLFKLRPLNTDEQKLVERYNSATSIKGAALAENTQPHSVGSTTNSTLGNAFNDKD